MFDKINKFETKSFYCELNIMIVIYVLRYIECRLLCVVSVYPNYTSLNISRCLNPFFRMKKSLLNFTMFCFKWTLGIVSQQLIYVCLIMFMCYTQSKGIILCDTW